MDERDQRIAQLEQQLGRALEEMATLRAHVEQQLAERDARIAELEEQLGGNSSNSSRPPSSDGPWKKPPAPRRTPTGKKSGGQAGHTKHERTRLAPEQVDAIGEVVPERCAGCGKGLSGADPAPQRHQVWSLPKLEATVTEYRRHTLDCADCGRRTTAPLPAGVPRGAFDPSVHAWVGVLMGAYKLSKRAVAELLAQMAGVTMSLGAVLDCQQQVSSALEVPYDEAKNAAKRAPVKYADETGWKQGKARFWLWTVVTATVTVFAVHAERSTEAAQSLLGKIRGILVTDRHGAYTFWTGTLRQVCWAHLIRDFTKIAERKGQSAALGNALLAQAHAMVTLWHRVRDGTLARSSFQTYLRPIRVEIDRLLRQGLLGPHLKTARTCKKILGVSNALFTFATYPGVEPTNNTAERAVRHAVLWRKGSFGTQSEAGSRFVERILTVHATLRNQGRSVFNFVESACRARLEGTAAPSLLPQTLPR